MFIQTTHRLDTIRVNIDIDMPYMPCDVIGVDVEDSVGNHIQDYYGELHKHRIDADGKNINIETWKEKNENRRVILDKIKRELKEEQGCRIEGFIDVVRVPGNFHISHHAFRDILQALERDGIKLDNSFKINHLSFGQKTDMESIARRFPDTDLKHTLDGFEMEKSKKDLSKHMRVGFFLNAVPSEFEADHGVGDIFTTEAFQLTSSYEIDNDYGEDVIFFNF